MTNNGVRQTSASPVVAKPPTTRAGQGRDPEVVRVGIERWFGSYKPEATSIHVANPAGFAGNGASNESFVVDIGWTGHDRTEHLDRMVLRLPPLSGGLFPDYDLERQSRLQSVLADQGVRTVRPLAYVDDPHWLGAPFMVMPFVAGAVPPDHPESYCMSGWLVDADLQARSHLMSDFLRQLAALHRVDWKAAGLSFLARDGLPGILGELQWTEYHFAWAVQGMHDSETRLLRKALAWCRDNMPTATRESSVLWGDARIGNVIFDAEFNVSAMLDWETASICPAERDLAWVLSSRELNARKAGRVALPELDGFPDRASTIAEYEEYLGRPLHDLHWHEVFAAVAVATCIFGMRKAMRARGLVSDEHVPIQKINTTVEYYDSILRSVADA